MRWSNGPQLLYKIVHKMHHAASIPPVIFSGLQRGSLAFPGSIHQWIYARKSWGRHHTWSVFAYWTSYSGDRRTIEMWRRSSNFGSRLWHHPLVWKSCRFSCRKVLKTRREFVWGPLWVSQFAKWPMFKTATHGSSTRLKRESTIRFLSWVASARKYCYFTVQMQYFQHRHTQSRFPFTQGPCLYAHVLVKMVPFQLLRKRYVKLLIITSETKTILEYCSWLLNHV